MKLITFDDNGRDKAAIFHEDMIYPIEEIGETLPATMSELLNNWELSLPMLQKLNQEILDSSIQGKSFEQISLVAPVPNPTSCRDAYAFRQHVASARKNRGVDMIPEFDQFPIFYFTNHNAITGPGNLNFMPDHFDKLDFELEVAIVVGKKGRNISASEADEYIAGYMIMNDWSARTLQMEEMKLNLGPAKGKDFATTIGPWLVTTDELQQYKVESKEGHTGDSYDLNMKCRVNGELKSEGSMADMDWTFAEILERVSYGVDIYPGDVIGSGTVGTGCFLELNGTGKRLDPGNFVAQWIQPDDTVEMEITGLGKLSNKAIKTEGHSLLSLKKNLAVS